MSSSILGQRPKFCYCHTVSCLLMWGALSGENAGLSFTTAGGPRQRSHFRVWAPRDSWPYFTVSNSRLPQPGGPGPRIYIPQEQGGPVIPPGTWFPFRRLLRLAGLWWKYLNTPQGQSYFATGGLHKSVCLGAKSIEAHDQIYFTTKPLLS
jgi:hypothetical protein